MTSYTRRPLWAHGTSGVFLGLVAFGLAALLGGCSSGGITKQERGPEAYKPHAAALATLGYRWDWSGFPAPADGARVLFMDAYPDVVVTQDSSSKVVVIESGSGRVRWSSELAGSATKFVGPVRDRDPSRGDRLLVSSESEGFILELHTGNLLGRQRYEKVVNTKPVLVGPVAWFGTPSGEMYGHLITRNVKFNGYQMPGSIEQPLALIGGSVLGGVTQRGEVAFIDAASGGLLGRTKIYGGTATRPAASDSAMYVASLDQSLYAFTATGHTLWRKRTGKPLTAQPTFYGQTVYCEIADSGLTAFDAASGKQRWANEGVGGTVIGIRKKRLMVWDGKTMFLLDPDSGNTVERVELPNVVHFALEKFEDGNLYAVNRAGVIGKFLPR